MKDEALENYLTYLIFLNTKLAKFFASQKQFIFCEKGCAKCCKNAEFPYSQIELKYLLCGFLQLDNKTQNKIEENIKRIVEEKSKYEGDAFRYTCPFLIDDVCSVYDYRGIVCRTFGLLTKGVDDRVKVPFCCYEGLNYSNVMDKRTKKISEKKIKKLKLVDEPLGFNVSYKFLTDPDFEKSFKFEFGEKKPLIDWFYEMKDKLPAEPAVQNQ